VREPTLSRQWYVRKKSTGRGRGARAGNQSHLPLWGLACRQGNGQQKEGRGSSRTLRTLGIEAIDEEQSCLRRTRGGDLDPWPLWIKRCFPREPSRRIARKQKRRSRKRAIYSDKVNCDGGGKAEFLSRGEKGQNIRRRRYYVGRSHKDPGGARRWGLKHSQEG